MSITDHKQVTQGYFGMKSYVLYQIETKVRQIPIKTNFIIVQAAKLRPEHGPPGDASLLRLRVAPTEAVGE